MTTLTASSVHTRRRTLSRRGLGAVGLGAVGLVALGLALLPAAGMAQTGPALGSNGKPIEITADRLVVDQQKQIATFSGHVDAVQGDMSLRADELKVFYAAKASGDTAKGDQAKGDQAKGDQAKTDQAKGDQAKGDQAKGEQAKGGGAKSDRGKRDQAKGQAGKGGGLSANQSIQRIEAVGNVVIAAPAQTATGDRGVYDVDNSSITLDGDVVLTRAENVVRGGHLVYDLSSGLVTITPPGTAEGQPARVRALFKPQPAPAKGP